MALPVPKVRLKIGDDVQKFDVALGHTVMVFTVQVGTGPADVEADLLDSDGLPLCSAFYASIRKMQETK